MTTLKDVQLKIAAVKKTKQITKAMNMVAASRLRGAQTRMDGFRPYANKFGEVLGNLAARAGDDASPLLIPKDDVKKIHIVLCTSDRGLCGGFNANILDLAETTIEEKEGQDIEFSITAFGKKGRDWARKSKIKIINEHLNVVGGKIDFSVAMDTGQFLIDSFLSGKFDEVHVISAEFLNMGKQLPVKKKLLPIPPIEKKVEETESYTGYQAEHICEPSPAALLSEMLPRNVYVQLYNALLETTTSEHAARMMAMDNATKACNDMLENLTLAYNKARQAAITAELMDIVGGAEALKG